MTAMAAEIRPIIWRKGRLLLLDQRKLPAHEVWVECRGARSTARAIRSMVVRGAPAIGVAAAYGMAAEAARFRPARIRQDFERAAGLLLAARPTAVNLAWALDRMGAVLVAAGSAPGSAAGRDRVARLMRAEAAAIHHEDVASNRRLGEHGAPLLVRAGGVMTHCNAGALATAGYGTALGVIRSAWERGTRFDVFATETRPYLQGARLTAWELTKLRIPVTLLTDSGVGSLMQGGRVAAVVVGTDRTAANGDVANKVGTYPIAVLAKRHGVPFYVAAPTASIDLGCSSGSDIPIEQREAAEVTRLAGREIATPGVRVLNPAFDVTPAELVTAIITEAGVVKDNFKAGLARAVKRAQGARRAGR